MEAVVWPSESHRIAFSSSIFTYKCSLGWMVGLAPWLRVSSRRFLYVCLALQVQFSYLRRTSFASIPLHGRSLAWSLGKMSTINHKIFRSSQTVIFPKRCTLGWKQFLHMMAPARDGNGSLTSRAICDLSSQLDVSCGPSLPMGIFMLASLEERPSFPGDSY